ncbi:MAG: ABC transporter permease [Marinilabiliales bacterium]|nr:MAG: ABC transporter permease [Marinilabiliales bacterium]
MRKLIKIAWRNLWRNRRRTFITAASIMFALMIALVMRGFQIGSYDRMVYNVVHAYSGYFQIHANGYQDEQILNNAMEESDEVKSLIAEYPNVEASPRIESFVLTSYGTQTKGAMLVGMDPEAENNLTSVSGKLIEGEFLSPDDEGALISSRLAAYLKIGVGDSLVLLGQGLYGASAAGIFVIKGILKFPSPDLDNKMVYTSLPAAQNFFSAQGYLTSIAFNMEDADKMNETVADFRAKLDTSVYEVMTWEEMQPEMVQQIEGDNKSGIIMLGILYLIVGFGILGTVLMITTERTREFGVMMAIGMKKLQLVFVQIVEMFFVGLIGIVLGTAVALPVIGYFLYHPIKLSGGTAEMMIEYGFEPIMPVVLQSDYFISQILVVLIIVLISVIIAAIKILRLKTINALRK